MKTIKLMVLAAALCLTAGLNAFAADIKTDYDHNANFSRIHTYSWGQVNTSNPLYVDRIKEAVDRDLQAKGMQMVASGGDVTVFAHGSVHNEKELETFYNGFGGGWGGRWGWGGWGPGGWGETTTTVNNQPVAMLVIDVFDGSSKNLIWRGSSTSEVSGNVDKNTRNLDKDVDKMFKSFPPKGAS